MKTLIFYLFLIVTSLHLSACSEGMPKHKGLGQFNTFCISSAGVEGELHVEAFEIDGKPTYDVEWWIGETGSSLTANGGVLKYDFMLFGSQKADGFVQLSRPKSGPDKRPSNYNAQFIFFDKETAKPQAISAKCENGYW